MSQVFIWKEGRSYGFALYAYCPLCGQLVRLGGFPSEADPEEEAAKFTASDVAELCAAQNRAHPSCVEAHGLEAGQ